MAIEFARIDTMFNETSITVTPMFRGVDRPQGYGMGFPNTPAGRRLAERYRRYLKSGEAFPGLHVKTDVNGKTYAFYSLTILGRTANADLKRLGF